MKIAVFYHLPFGGAKRVVKEHVKGLRDLGHTVDVYTINKEEDIFDPSTVANSSFNYEFETIKLSLPLVGRIIKDFQIFTFLKLLHKKIASDIDLKNYDIALVHTDTYTQSPYLLGFLKTNNVYFCLEPLRIVYEYSLDIPVSIRGLNRLYERLTRYIRKSVDRKNARSSRNSLAISYFGREYMIHAYNLYPKVSYLGVDEKLFKSIGAKRKKQILFVAEKEYIYGYDLIQDALALIAKSRRPTLKLIFGTKGSQRITEEELVKAYSESLVTVSLSRYDTFGLVPFESMACGTPVIALNVAGYRETISNGKNGYLVDFDPQEIANRIEFLIDNPQECQQMGEAGRKWVERAWTWKIQIKNLENLLQGFIKHKI
jgi:glycosyltransferase involved in cell wall biosynthesis